MSVALSRAAAWGAMLASPRLLPIVLLVGSNLFMTLAWYWHLRFKEVPLAGVQNLENGISVRVRVNDRGPFVKGRIVDVSEAAARALRFIRRGIARVRLFRCA